MVGVAKIPWWHRLPRRVWRLVATVDDADNVPDDLPRNGAVLVGSRRKPKWLVFDCPCHSGHRVMLNLDPKRSPYWRVELPPAALTLRPSVDFDNAALRCHFFIRRGHTVWVREEEES